ncbi:hypothetical protein TEP_04000 [Stenotrophomonas sp. TEPEL]|uniref:hypothetical protein n=1 Tax=Stenotrophomonas sp. TEPEL TaxID=2283801 RepID=UPI001045C6F1|nr:hypothetical protein [Stenotrophomonas sp. TEPEL]TDB32886.1 hypothetical protein TEP_04000 [Stenotrophomonas sp. TEPEL]
MKHSLLLAILATGLALAASAQGKEPVLQPGKPLLAQIEQIEKQLGDGETYSELSGADRSRVRETLSRLRGVGEQYANGVGMPESVQTQVFNDQEVVNVLLTQAREDSRLICRREKAIGSNRTTTQCSTVAERARQREAADRDLARAQRGGHTANN